MRQSTWTFPSSSQPSVPPLTPYVKITSYRRHNQPLPLLIYARDDVAKQANSLLKVNRKKELSLCPAKYPQNLHSRAVTCQAMHENASISCAAMPPIKRSLPAISAS